MPPDAIVCSFFRDCSPFVVLPPHSRAVRSSRNQAHSAAAAAAAASAAAAAAATAAELSAKINTRIAGK